MRLILITGRSGSGKSLALNILEDLGFSCIHNLPLGLLSNLPDHLADTQTDTVVSIDTRNLQQKGWADPFIEKFIAALAYQKIQSEIIYLDANNEKLLERFSETRRKHPLSDEKLSLREALELETTLLVPFAATADLRIDTSELNINQFRKILTERVAPEKKDLSILFQSFAYKQGVPQDSDYVFDVRSLPNPYWEPGLRPLTGRDKAIADFLEKQSSVKAMEEAIIHFLIYAISEHKSSSRHYLTISIGCTGGQHRSVYIAERLYAYFSQRESDVKIRHDAMNTASH